MLKRIFAAAALLLALTAPVFAQQVAAHAVPIGRGAGVTGFNAATIGTAGRVLVDKGAATDPAFTAISGDGSLASSGALTLDAEIHCLAALTSAADKIAYYTGSGTCALTDLSSFWRTVLDDTSASASRTTLGLAIGTNVEAWDADLDTWATVTPSANGKSLVAAADYAAMRALLDVEAGTDFYSIAGADAAFQPKDADLTTIAGLTATTDNFLQAKSSAWASRTPTQVTADLIAFVGDSGSGGAKGLVPAPTTGDATKFLKGDGSWASIPGGGDALTTNPLSQFASTTSAQLAGVMSDETGTNKLVYSDSPTLVTPALGTPSALTLTNATGLPIAGLVSSTSTALGVGSLELGAASDTTLTRSAAGVMAVEGVDVLTTSNTKTLTNKTYDTAGSGNVFKINGTAVSDITGTGKAVLDTSPTIASPTLTTPALGAATGASVVLTGTGAQIIAAGRQGGTTPAFSVDASAGSSATGIKITAAAAASRASLSVISSGTDEGLSIDAKGAGSIRLGATSTGAVEFSRNLVPTANDGAALGTTALSFSDLFMATGAVVNIANGDWVMTHTTGIETVGTGDLRVTNAGTNSASVVTVGGTQTLTSKTLTSPTIAKIGNLTTSGLVTTSSGDGTLSVTAPGTGILTWLATPSSANLRSALTDESGTGAAYFQGGDAGTPSAIVLTNGTGLPIAGLTSSTSTALGVGSLELGAASDTTLARVSAGVASIEGVNILTTGTGIAKSGQTLARFFPANDEPPSSNYAVFTTRNGHPALGFDTTTGWSAIFTGILPCSYNGGGITVQTHTMMASATSGTVGYLVAIERIDDSSLDLDADSFASDQTITAATVPGTSGQTLSQSVNISSGANMDSLAACEQFRLKITRDVANDNAAGDAQLVSVLVKEQ